MEEAVEIYQQCVSSCLYRAAVLRAERPVQRPPRAVLTQRTALRRLLSAMHTDIKSISLSMAQQVGGACLLPATRRPPSAAGSRSPLMHANTRGMRTLGVV